ncbi:hypothetical protein ABPG75_011744 [Micractinium tetrahymenae]
MSGSEDELDALLQRYEQQAAADVAAVQQQAGGQGSRKRQKLSAADKREAALSQPLGADNKGFKLLAAMGYQQGQRIGKEGTGLAEPLPLLLKQDKLGLGAVSKKAAAREEQRRREEEAARRSAAAATAAEVGRAEAREDFKTRAAAAAAARRLDGQLRKAQQVCETLDTAAGIAANVMWQQPPAAAAATGSAGGGDDLLEPLEHRHAKDAGAAAKAGREEAADFARLYRHQQLADGAAPAAVAAAAGDSEDAAVAGGNGEAAATAAAAAELEAWQALPPAEQLAALIGRLRDHYCYCLYCGCRYDSDADMQQHCRGPSEADHE